MLGVARARWAREVARDALLAWKVGKNEHGHGTWAVVMMCRLAASALIAHLMTYTSGVRYPSGALNTPHCPCPPMLIKKTGRSTCEQGPAGPGPASCRTLRIPARPPLPGSVGCLGPQGAGVAACSRRACACGPPLADAACMGCVGYGSGGVCGAAYCGDPASPAAAGSLQVCDLREKTDPDGWDC